MAYTVPRVEIEQQFNQNAVFTNNPQCAFIFGPHYGVVRYSNSADRAVSRLGYYTSGLGFDADLSGTGASETVAWPYIAARDATSTVDIASVTALDGVVTTFPHISIILENAFIKYFGASVSDIRTAPTGTDDGVVLVSSTTQSEFYASVNLKASTSGSTSYARSDYFAGRDVQVGDYVTVTGTNNASAAISITTRIVGISQDSLGRYRKIRTADIVFGTGTRLVSTSAGTRTYSLWARVPVASVPASSALSASTTSAVAQMTATAGNITISDPLLFNQSTKAVVNWTVTSPPKVLAADSAVPFAAADVFASYRAKKTTFTTAVASLTDPATVEATLGIVSPENPLAQGVYDALLNSSGTPVYFMATTAETLAAYNTVLETVKRASILTGYVYGLVPLTTDKTILDAVVSHVNTMSTVSEAKWRKAWICPPIVTTEYSSKYGFKTVDAGSGVITYWQATIADDTDSSVTNQRLVTVANATFITDGIAVGDYVDLYTDTSATAATTLSAALRVIEVRAENTLVVIHTADVSTAQTIRIRKLYTTDEQINNLAAVGSSYNNRRVNPVFPTTVKSGGVSMPGYFMAAALAGLRAGSVPHQPLTNVEVLGFDDLTDAVTTYTETQLNRLAESGYWIVTQSQVGAVPYVRHQLTSDGSSTSFAEDSITTNVDSISYGLQRALSGYIGKYNINPTTLNLIYSAINRQLKYHMTNTFTASAGNQLLGYKILSFGKSDVFKDKVAAEIELELPYPVNTITVKLIVP